MSNIKYFYLLHNGRIPTIGGFERGSFKKLFRGSREVKAGNVDVSSEVAEEYRGKVLKKLCNVLSREFALISMWRVPAMPLGPIHAYTA
ncbi:hypothetical protein QVD17_39510 [Tagetes erecta]|uniref:Uncharacterized protein n=1 Tax=Tagetes erecta TaxID=13708 RepID=A0AAD8NH65_TARER|nr:hypothetical protein QVD17_39510 [Tagetes erecta]